MCLASLLSVDTPFAASDLGLWIHTYLPYVAAVGQYTVCGFQRQAEKIHVPQSWTPPFS